ncbi:MAG TPA: riboflavin synthase [Terriglobales bacterium]|nr:riboflavin synthase [Terriglobales bacterium]
MFTGIVQAVGRVELLERRRAGARLEIDGAASLLRGLKRGDSIAVNGCCLTIVARRGGRFAADLSSETLEKTTLGGMARGIRVNLEPPLRAGDALSGHLMQGHVEATGRVLEIAPELLCVAIPASLLRYVALKGTLAVDGISLTVARMDRRAAQFAIIPHTFRHTNLSHLRAGMYVNLETDPLARHLERLLEARKK